MASRSPTRRPRPAAPAARKAARTRRAKVRPAAKASRTKAETKPKRRSKAVRRGSRAAVAPLRARRGQRKPAASSKSAPVFRFKPGDRVRIREGTPKGHCRTPYYVRGKLGVVESCLGHFRNSEQLAYGRPGLPKTALYAVRLPQPELWQRYPGPGIDTLVVELSEFWLAAA